MAPIRSRRRAAAGLFALAGCWAGAVLAEGSLPSVQAGALAHGPYSYMHMLFQKTFLRINVATIEVRVDQPAQARLAALAQGQKYSDALAQQLAGAAIGAQRAVVEMKFKRDIGLDRWIGVVRENLEQARKAGLISPDLERRVGQGLPQWFSPLKERGYRKGDRLVYGVEPDSLRTVVVSVAGQVFVDRLEKEQGTRKVVLASYFAPGSEFREALLKSLFEGNR
jgi:hypothetical protein